MSDPSRRRAMKRKTLATLVAAVCLVALAGALPAQAAVISLGIIQRGSESLTYGYGEFDLLPTLAAGLQLRSDEVFVVSLWQGAGNGIYLEVEFDAAGANKELLELGVWRRVPVANTVDLSGWLGVQSRLGGPSIWVKANAELAFRLTNTAGVFFGGSATLLKKDSVTATYIGVGHYF